MCICHVGPRGGGWCDDDKFVLSVYRAAFVNVMHLYARLLHGSTKTSSPTKLDDMHVKVYHVVQCTCQSDRLINHTIADTRDKTQVHAGPPV